MIGTLVIAAGYCALIYKFGWPGVLVAGLHIAVLIAASTPPRS